MVGISFHIIFEGDKACQRGDKSTCATDVYSEKQLSVIVGKLGQKYCRGDVGYHLTAKGGENKRIYIKKVREKVSYCIYPTHITCKDKEKYEGKEQTVIHLQKRLAIKEEQDDGYYDKAHQEVHKAEYYHDRESKEDKVYYHSAHGDIYGLLLDLKLLIFNEYKTAEGYQSDRDQEGRKHNAYKLTVGNIKFGVQVKVLRISKGGKHTAEICGNVLHNKGKCQIFFLLRGVQNKVTKGQEGQQSHIVGYKHRADKGYVYQGQNGYLCIFKSAHYLSCHGVEKSDVTERAHHCQNTEKAGQSLKVKVLYILLVGPYDKRGDYRRDQRNKKNRVGLYPLKDRLWVGKLF